MNAAHLTALIVIVLALAVSWTGALVSVIWTASTPTRRTLWTVALLLLPLLGPYLWFAGGRRAERAAA